MQLLLPVIDSAYFTDCACVRTKNTLCYWAYICILELSAKGSSNKISKYIKGDTIDFLCHINHLLKLVSAIFILNFCFSTKWYPFQNYGKCFLFHEKSSFRSRDIQNFVIFSLPFHTLQIQKDKWKWNNLWCHELACINLQMQFLK